jgi:ATP-dependent Clp protease ATP-binding subunit ClpA
MFERFTDKARHVVVSAQDEARALRHNYVGTEHLLLSLCRNSGVANKVLTEAGVAYAAVRDQVTSIIGLGPEPLTNRDAEALAAIGISLDDVVARIEEAFGPDALWRRTRTRPRRRRLRGRRARCEPTSGHLPFTPRTKKVLALALREAVSLRHGYVGTEHILLGMLREGEGVGIEVVERLGASPDALRRDVLDAVARSA